MYYSQRWKMKEHKLKKSYMPHLEKNNALSKLLYEISLWCFLTEKCYIADEIHFQILIVQHVMLRRISRVSKKSTQSAELTYELVSQINLNVLFQQQKKMTRNIINWMIKRRKRTKCLVLRADIQNTRVFTSKMTIKNFLWLKINCWIWHNFWVILIIKNR